MEQCRHFTRLEAERKRYLAIPKAKPGDVLQFPRQEPAMKIPNGDFAALRKAIAPDMPEPAGGTDPVNLADPVLEGLADRLKAKQKGGSVMDRHGDYRG